MNAIEARTLSIQVTMDKIMNRVKETTSEGLFSSYFRDDVENIIVKELRSLGFEVKPGYSGGFFVAWR